MVHRRDATGRPKSPSAKYIICYATSLLHADLHAEDEQSYLEEPPETPAPLFAVRAFKSALFGTPHPVQGATLKNEKKSVPSTAVNAEESFQQRHQPQPIAHHPRVDSELSHEPRSEPSASPAKGILLTPGTAATKRKTVSFGKLGNITAGEIMRNPEELKNKNHTVNEEQAILFSSALRSESKNQNSLTKDLFKAQLEASKKRLSSEADQGKLTTRTLLPVAKNNSFIATTGHEEVKEAAVDTTADTTIDLSQPRSRSGQHWKAEYELYHKNSSREMKKIIKYGQNVKSYALKKDSEATSLGEKLKQELSKLAVMEAKVSKLVTQLAKTPRGGPDGDADQIALMSDLARQTTLAVRYKHRADMYQKAIESNNLVDPRGPIQSETIIGQEDKTLLPKSLPIEKELNEPPSELTSLRTELETFKENVKSTEDKAKMLEAENSTLKRSLARVKEEMNNYENRRLAREQKLKSRETKLQQEMQEYEKKLAETTSNYQNLLRLIEQHSKKPAAEHDLPKQATNDEAALTHVKVGRHEDGLLPREFELPNSGYKNSNPITPKRQRRQENVSPNSRTSHERRVLPAVQDTATASGDDAKNQSARVLRYNHEMMTQMSNMDIWMMGSPGGVGPSISPSKGFAQSSHFDLLRNETNHALQEINQNLVSELPIQTQSSSQHLDGSKYDRASPRKAIEVDSSILPIVSPSVPNMPSAVRRMHEKRLNISSPRPSIVSFTSSPPQKVYSNPTFRPAMALEGRSPLVAGPREQRDSSIVSSSTRTSTMTSAKRLSALPADRAAAAKARLQKRSMEKQKSRDMSRENARA